VVDADALHQLVRRFTDDRIAAVGGLGRRPQQAGELADADAGGEVTGTRTSSSRTSSGVPPRDVSVGCLTAYGRAVLIELEPVLEKRSVLGVPIKYGEDRFLTRQIVKAGYLTTMTLQARCRTFVPSTLSAYFSQQLRWRRSNIVTTPPGSATCGGPPRARDPLFQLFALLLVYPNRRDARASPRTSSFPRSCPHEAVVFFGMLYRWRNPQAAERRARRAARVHSRCRC